MSTPGEYHQIMEKLIQKNMWKKNITVSNIATITMPTVLTEEINGIIFVVGNNIF